MRLEQENVQASFVGAPPRTPLGKFMALPRPPDPLTGLRGLILKEREKAYF